MAEKKEWTSKLLWHNKNDKEIDKLFNIYEKNKRNARVVFLSGEHRRFEYLKLYLFEDPDSDEFDFVLFRVKHGISVTNKMYTHKKRVQTFRYREKNGFWKTEGRNIRRPINFQIFQFGDCDKIVKMYMANKFSWYRCILENHMEVGKHMTLHTVWSKKLFNLNKLLKVFYGVPIQTAQKLHENLLKDSKNYSSNMRHGGLAGVIRKNKRFIKNIENLQDWHFDKDVEHILKDSIDMARKLDKIVNFSWSKKRLRQEHDDWSEELTRILFIDDNKGLTIKGVYKLFAAYSKYYMIKTTRGLATEGKKQKHCVGGYGNKINGGGCAIYHINGYTLELTLVDYISKDNENNGRLTTNYGRNTHQLSIAQFRGYLNENAPEELRKEVQEKVDEFNEKFKEHGALTNSWYSFENDKEYNTYGQFNITAGAEDYEIFDLDKLDDDGEPTQILVDETIQPSWRLEADEEIAVLFEDNLLDGDEYLPF